VVVFLSVNVATPLPLVFWLAGVIDELPAPWVGATLVPAIWLPLASRSVTVSVALSMPSASAEPGAAATLDCVASTEPATTVKEIASAVSAPEVAVTVSAPAVVPVTVFCATPLAAVAEPVPLTAPTPAVCAKLTEVELSPVSVFPAASSTVALSVRPEPEERLPVAPETTS
jgi:hypothetical protein